MSNERPPPDSASPTEFEPDPDTDDMVPVPDYEADQYIPREKRISNIRQTLIRDEFGYIRAYFIAREDKHTGLQRSLNQAQMGTTYDVYLTKSLWYSIGAGTLGALIGLLVSWLFARTGVFGDVSSPWTPSNETLLSVMEVISANQTAIGVAGLTVVLAGLFGVITWYMRYYTPSYIVDTRRRNINITLPHAIVYMYALSFGGMDFVKVLRRTAETEDTYGEVANEFDTVVKDIDMFGSDLFTALRNARNRTPSDSMEQFLDDMLSMLDSGGDVTEFLREEANKQRERAMREQEQFLDTLGLLSEVFIVGFVAAPLFFVVTLMMMSFLGQDTLPILFVLVYAVMPLGMLGFIVLVATLSEPYRQPTHEPDRVRNDHDPWPAASTRRFPQFKLFRRIRVRERVKSVLTSPVEVFKQNPLYTLFISVPVTAAVVGFLWTTMDAVPMDFFNESFRMGLWLVVLPFLMVTVPLSVFHELNERRKRHVAKRLPDTLDILASANQMGLSLSEGLDMVSRNATGEFADELIKVRNDIEWNADVRSALLSLAARVRVPQLTRTCKILAEGSRSTGELYKILSIAAEDTRQRYRIERSRNQELQAYTSVVIIGFLVYLSVIVILEFSFLGTIAEQVGEAEELAEAGLITITGDTIDLYQALFFHSALVMGVGTGIISGKLTNNSVLTGLKYAIGLVLLSVVVFGVLG